VTSRSSEAIDRSRRAFLRGSLFSLEGRREAEREKGALGPLPPALTAEMAEGNPCVDCAAPCIPACEPGIVRLHPEGHALAGLPYLTFHDAGCTFCADCIDACPLDRAAAPPPTRLGLAVLEQSTCMAWNGVICMSCQQACTDEAILLDHRFRPGIDLERCTGCGACVSVCPSDAIDVAFTVEGLA